MSQNSKLPRISSLHGALINQIAAGEVIERPSSVVKELVENAIDSGASRIEIHIERGGTEKILIMDNGCGIHPDDMEIAINRHTTSKLRDQEGLNAINSLGFRGEALSSIAAVSDLSIVSRIDSADHAMRLEFDPYTTRSNISPASANTGTTVEILKLFQPVPARRKFLRSAKTEYLHILELIKRFMMSHYDVEFQFYHNGRQVLACPACNGDFSGRISSVMGKSFYQNAWFVDNSIENVRVWGWLGNEQTFRNQSDRQYLFLNNRIIKDKHINHAIRKAMDNIIHESRFPSFIIYVDVEPSIVDVNVHPTKQEVRFRSPRTIHDFIYAVISDGIRQNRMTSLLADENNKKAYESDGAELFFNKSQQVNDDRENYFYSQPELMQQQDESSPFGLPIMLLSGNILVARYQQELRLIDFSNLRKRYLFNALSEQLSRSGVKFRPLLVPVNIDLNEEQVNLVISNTDILLRTGYDITQSGPQSILVRSVPSLLPGVDIRQFIDMFINKIQPGPESKFEMKLLEFTVEELSLNEDEVLSLDEINVILKQCKDLDLPFKDRNVQGFWRTVTSQELKQIINNG